MKLKFSFYFTHRPQTRVIDDRAKTASLLRAYRDSNDYHVRKEGRHSYYITCLRSDFNVIIEA